MTCFIDHAVSDAGTARVVEMVPDLGAAVREHGPLGDGGEAASGG